MARKKTRKKTCTKCGRNLWVRRDYYTEKDSWCKGCCRKQKNDWYAQNRKVPDGVRYDPLSGLCWIKNGSSKRIHWSEAMEAKLRRMFPTTKNEDLAVEFGISQRTIGRKAAELRLTKDPQWMKAHRDANLLTMRVLNKYRGNTGQFKKGEHASAETEFKAGIPRRQNRRTQ